MLKLLHVSDIHFGPPYRPQTGEAVFRLLPEIRPDIVIVSGDLTQRATKKQFLAAKEFLARFAPKPLLVVPGNHDVPLYRVYERMVDPYGLYREHICPDLDLVLKHPGATIVGLNSTAPRRAITNGRIDPWQLKFCAKAFAETPAGHAKIVVAHHHFLPAPDDEFDQIMPGARRAMRRFVEMGVDMILGGHLHRAYIGDSLDFYPELQRGHQGVIIVQCGTTTSRRGRAREKARNSLNVVEIDDGTIGITHFLYFEDTDRFEPTSRHLFPRAGCKMPPLKSADDAADSTALET